MRVFHPKSTGSGGARLGRLGFDPGIIVDHSLKEKLFLYFPSSWKQRHQPTTMAAKSARLSLAFPQSPVSLELHAAGQGPVDHQIGSGRKTRGGAGEKDDAAADLLRLGHPPGRIQRERVLIQV